MKPITASSRAKKRRRRHRPFGYCYDHDHMTIFAPPHPHASTEPAGYCSMHDERSTDLYRKGSDVGARLWHVSGVLPVLALTIRDRLSGLPSTPAPDGLSLAAGTRLRLDAAHQGRYFDGGDQIITNQRFCVVEGPLAGTCWDSYQSFAVDGEVFAISDPVEPLIEGLTWFGGDALLAALTDLTDRQRLDFARWLEAQPPTNVEIALAWETDHRALAQAEAEAVKAFDQLRGDGTVTDTDSQALLDRTARAGSPSWALAIATVRAMAGASQLFDRAALSTLEPTAEWLVAAAQQTRYVRQS